MHFVRDLYGRGTPAASVRGDHLTDELLKSVGSCHLRSDERVPDDLEVGLHDMKLLLCRAVVGG